MKRKTLQEKLDTPVGLTYDVLYDVRRAMRILRRVEKRIVTAHRAEKRRFKESREWPESKRIRDEHAEANRAARMAQRELDAAEGDDS